uniref:Uncharacterized protein n=1 Tax=Trichobilharzia regenti TaxID=157069 RepID=A0AA85JJC9_TRIRE|nr:unnamed protein product [Trichobilharzia regenti]
MNTYTESKSLPVTRDWSSGICNCFDDMNSCYLTTFCLPCYLCYLYDVMGEACWLPVIGSGPLKLRIKHRMKQHIVGNLADDYCVSKQMVKNLNITVTNI